MQNRLKAFIFAASLALTAAAVAHAQQPDVTFQYNRHELETEYGAKRLYDRLVRRAESACKSSNSVTLWRIRAEKECAKALTNDLVTEINHPRLAAMHANAIRIAQQ